MIRPVTLSMLMFLFLLMTGALLPDGFLLAAGGEVFYFKDYLENPAADGSESASSQRTAVTLGDFWEDGRVPRGLDPQETFPLWQREGHIIIYHLDYWMLRSRGREYYTSPKDDSQALVGDVCAFLSSRPSGISPSMGLSLTRWFQRRSAGDAEASSFYTSITILSTPDDGIQGQGPWMWDLLRPGVLQWIDMDSGRRGVIEFEEDQLFPHPAARRSLRSGEALIPSEWSVKWEDPGRGRALYVDPKELSRGEWEARRDIREGQVLTRGYVKATPLVQGGDEIILRIQRGAISVEMSVFCCHEAYPGDALRVRAASGRVYKGILQPRGVVELPEIMALQHEP